MKKRVVILRVRNMAFWCPRVARPLHTGRDHLMPGCQVHIKQPHLGQWKGCEDVWLRPRCEVLLNEIRTRMGNVWLPMTF